MEHSDAEGRVVNDIARVLTKSDAPSPEAVLHCATLWVRIRNVLVEVVTRVAATELIEALIGVLSDIELDAAQHIEDAIRRILGLGKGNDDDTINA